MTRLERAALDYVISHLSKEVRSWWPDEIRRALPEDMRQMVWMSYHAINAHGRVASARLALYLRLLRRVDAWERDEEWAEPVRQVLMRVGHCEQWLVDGSNVWRLVCPWETRLAPWHPLWLDAPPHDPAITPRMRREAKGFV